MKTILKEYKDIFKKIFNDYKLLVFILAAVCILGYGFTIVNHSIGIDNNAHELYYQRLGVLSLGRLTPLILDRVFGAYEYLPFWANGISVIVLYFSMLLWCAMFIKIGREKISQTALIIFSTVLVSYPIINEHFIFNPLNYALSYGLSAISLIIIYESAIKKKITLSVISASIMFFVISLNESFAAVYLCGVFFILILAIIYNDNKLSNKRFSYRFILISLCILIIAIVFEFLVLKILNAILPSIPKIGAANQNIFWFRSPFVVTLKKLFYGLVNKYILMADSYFPITVFLFAGAMSFSFALCYAIKKRKPVILLWMGLLYLSIISLSLIKGVVLPYRTSSSLGIFSAFIFMLIYSLQDKKWRRIVFGILMIVLVVNQTRILSSWFNNDYQRYAKDKEMAIMISNEIEENFDETKPVIFIGWVENSPNTKRIEGEYNGVSFIGNYSDKRESQNQFNYLLHDFFEIHGHSFNVASEKQYLNGRVTAKDMPSYPDIGYIVETDDYIVVNFN